MPTHAETARYLIEDDPRFMIITSVGAGLGSYDHYVGKANFNHTPIEENEKLDFASPIREGIWQTATPTADSWGYIITQEPDKGDHTPGGWRVRGFAQMADAQALMPLGAENVYFAEIQSTNTETYEEIQEAVQELEAARIAYNQKTPLELREAQARLAVGTSHTDYPADRETMEKLYQAGDGMAEIEMYVTFRRDGMTPQEAQAAVAAIA